MSSERWKIITETCSYCGGKGRAVSIEWVNTGQGEVDIECPVCLGDGHVQTIEDTWWPSQGKKT